jgi:hypothetical protein
MRKLENHIDGIDTPSHPSPRSSSVPVSGERARAWISVFRALGSGIPVLEIGRLRLWAIPGWRPRLYCYRAYGCLFVGVGYLGAMLFDPPPAY